MKIWILIASALSIVLLFNLFKNKTSLNKSPQTIIILNGASSSGKSSTAKKLEEQLHGQYLKIGADEFAQMLLPERWLNFNPATGQPKDKEGLAFVKADDEKGPKLIAQVGTSALKVFCAMPVVIAALAKDGNNMIVDAGITVDVNWLNSFIKNLKDFKVYFIKVTAPLAVREKREKERNGFIGLSRGQSEAMKDIEEKYNIPFDMVLDTSTMTSDEAAQKIIQFITSNSQPKAFKDLVNRHIF